VVDLVKELMDYSIHVHVIDPNGSPNELSHEYGITLIEEPIGVYDIIVLAVGHNEYK
jgi:UDP-N-acetyl-D-galactosamine dehydrogenase